MGNAEVDQNQMQGLVNLLQELFRFSLVEERCYLMVVWVVPFEKMEESIQAVAKVSQGNGTYRVGSYTPRGVAIPSENEGKLLCVILLADTLLQNVTPANCHQQELVSTLLEELLHIRFFGMRWEQSGYLRNPKRVSCKDDLITLASNAYYECAVNYTKSIIMGNIPLIEIDGELVTGQLTHAASISQSIESAYSKLEHTIIAAATGAMPIEVAYGEVLHLIYRDIFEPLARQIGYFEANPLGDHPFNDASLSPFYRDTVAPHWLETEKALKKSIASDFLDIDTAVTHLANHIEAFLLDMGVELSVLENQRCWVNFNTSFFDKRPNGL
jgi:hypothetical protein